MRKNTRQQGFTLIEMIVSIGLFSVVMVLGASTLLSVVDANRKTQSLKSAINNLNFAVESMARTIRVGSSYHCGASGPVPVTDPLDCFGGATFFAFEKENGISSDSEDQVVYCLYNGSVCIDTGKQIARSTDAGANYIAITAPDVVIDSLRFYVTGASVEATPPQLQPKVVVSIDGHVGDSLRTQTYFKLQTTVSQRLLDF